MPPSRLEVDVAAPARQPDGATRKQIRGSTLLLLGRCVALLINLAVQVITVRYLAKEDFGALAFALTMVALGMNISLFGLTKSLSRFIPIYHEQGDNAHLVGAVVLMFSTVLGLGLASVALVFGFHAIFGGQLASSQLSQSLLLLLVVLVPIDAFDRLLQSMFAAFGYVRSIFLRRHLIGPGLKLFAVLGVVLFGGGVFALAICYVVAGIVGAALYASLLYQLLVKEQLMTHFKPGAWKIPARDVFRFTLPLFSSQIGLVVRTSFAVLLLEVLRGSEQVADFRAVFPFARLNEVVIASFSSLFTPLAARLFVRGKTEDINQLYWRTSVWIMMFSLPAFLITGVLAKPFTSWVLGERYAAAGPVLLVLAVSFFIDAVMGFNVHTLRVFAKVRQIVVIDVLSIVTAVGLCFALIPSWGAMGAAVAICTATILQNVLFQVTMRLATGVGLIHWHYVRFYAISALGVFAVALVQWAFAPPFWVGFLLAAATYSVLFMANRSLMEIDDTFPELSRIPFVGSMLFASTSPGMKSAPEGRL